MKINGHTIKLDPFIVQKDKRGKEYKVASVEKDLTKAPKWVKEAGSNVEKFYWIIILKYLDGSKLTLKINHDNQQY